MWIALSIQALFTDGSRAEAPHSNEVREHMSKYIILVLLAGLVLAHPARAQTLEQLQEKSACVNAVNNHDAYAIDLCYPLARAGDADMQSMMGIIYDTNVIVPRDAAKAFYWYQQAGSQGDLSSQCSVAAAYLFGDGTSVNYAAALAWTKYGAGSADRFAWACNLVAGYIYHHGLGMPQDYSKARYYLRLAEPKFPGATRELAEIAREQAVTSGTSLRVPLSSDGYTVDGVVNGKLGRFAIDTGASGSQIPQDLADTLNMPQVGSITVTLADGTEKKMPTYIASSVCIVSLCAHDLQVTVGPIGLIGINFLRATGAQVKIADGTLTIRSAQ
jgi:predicted aspartyl protease